MSRKVDFTEVHRVPEHCSIEMGRAIVRAKSGGKGVMHLVVHSRSYSVKGFIDGNDLRKSFHSGELTQKNTLLLRT